MIAIGRSFGRVGSGLAISIAIAFTAVAGAWAQSTAPTSESVLSAAFENRYALDAISRVELVMRNGSGEEIRRKVHYITKIIDDRLHSIARLTAPEYLRGMTILTIERRDRSHDAFAFLPALGKTRRVTTAQKGDAFFGSDLTYEDLERKRTDEFELGELVVAESGGEAIYRIGGEPVHKGIYSRVEFDVAQSDHAILATRYYKSGEPEPYRVLETPRSSMVERGGHVLPARLLVSNARSETSTEVLIADLQVNASIPDRIFTVATLEQQRKLPEPKP